MNSARVTVNRSSGSSGVKTCQLCPSSDRAGKEHRGLGTQLLEVAGDERPPARVPRVEVRQLPEADPGGDVGEVRLSAREVDLGLAVCVLRQAVETVPLRCRAARRLAAPAIAPPRSS